MKDKLLTEFLETRLPIAGNFDNGLLKTQLAIFYEFLEEKGVVMQREQSCSKKKCSKPAYEFGLCFKHYCQGEI